MSAQPEVHIAGVLVQARPDASVPVREAIACIPQAQVMQHAADGRIVVVVEAGSAGEVVQRLEAMRAMPGVLNVALVYQHAEPADAMQQEMPT